MAKQVIRIVDVAFSHKPNSYGTGDLNLFPETMTWWRGNQIGDIVVITESCFHLVDQQKESVKIALIIEPPQINQEPYNWIKQNYGKFSHVLTYNPDLINSIPNAVTITFGGCWIKPEDQKIYEKTKGVSIIASDKKQTIGHRLRHEVIQKCKDKIDGIYGRGYNFVENKIESLKEFRYSIVIENDKEGGIVSEKFFDTIATGTIPIYYGHDWVKDNFDEDGILFFSNLAELEQCLKIATSEYYESRRHAIEKNFELCKSFQIPEDRLFKTFLQPKYFPK